MLRPRWAAGRSVSGRAHTTLGYENPARSDLVRATLRGIRRQRDITSGCTSTAR